MFFRSDSNVSVCHSNYFEARDVILKRKVIIVALKIFVNLLHMLGGKIQAKMQRCSES